MFHVIRRDELPPSPNRTVHWVVRGGRALITAGEEEIEAGPGDVIVVEPNTPHRFRNLGPGRLEIVCIHAADRMVTRWLNDEVLAEA